MKRFLFFLACSLFLTSCATTLKVNVTRPSELDLNGAQSISVLPFKPSSYYEFHSYATGVNIIIDSFFSVFDKAGPDERSCLALLRSKIEKGLIQSPYIEVVESSRVTNALKNDISSPADVYLTGEISRFSVHDELIERIKKIEKKSNDGDDSKKYDYVVFQTVVRYVKMVFDYQVVDAATGKIIAYNTEIINVESGEYEYLSNIPSAYSLLESDIEKLSKKILKQIQPYVVIKSIKLMDDKSKPKNEAFINADKLAKNGSLQESFKEFDSVYKKTYMMEAGYNAGLLLEAMGELSKAEEYLNNVYEKSKNKKVLNALYDVQNEIKQAERLKKQTGLSEIPDLNY